MRKIIVAAAASAPLMAGCADLATGLAMYADELDLQNGYYYEDEHYSERIGGDCPGLWEYGRANNQSYQRVRNYGGTSGSYTLTWSTGSQSHVTLASGETSQFFYMTPSVIPSSVDVEC